MRIIVTGSRNWTEPDPIWSELTDLYAENLHLVVVHGAGEDRWGRPCGADSIADDWVTMARSLGWNAHREPHPADWKRYHRRAGPIRNKEMVDLGVWCPDCQVEGLVAAWPRGLSRGTRGCMKLATAAGIRVENFSENRACHCGHPTIAHEHLRPGTDCALCDCPGPPS